MHAPGESHGTEPEELTLLAWLLGAPTPESPSLLGEAASRHPWLRQSAEALRHIALERWQSEHTRLFLNGYPETPCPPFQSAFRRGSFDGREADQLYHLYRQAGLVATPDLPADYLGTILEFGAWCLHHGEHSLWRTLHAAHIAGWVGDFAETLQRETRFPLYRVLAQRLVRLARP